MATKKVALVTGANKGLGLEIVKQLAQKGITVVLAARDEAKAAQAAQKLQAEGLDVHPLKLDITSAADIAKVPDALKSKFGGLDILVNNAGISGTGREESVDLLREVFETNLFGQYALTEALLPLLKASPAGRIVNQSSILGSLTFISSGQASLEWMQPAYSSSKAALNMVTVILAAQLKDTKIKVNAAHPGWVKTGMGGDQAPLDIPAGAKTAVDLATLPDDGPTGTYTHLGQTLPW
jgi:NAD(P)-dependent dehydrogenase (short-subunit alcohol dehydrogenase family)